MKRNLALMAAGGLTIIVALAILIAMLSAWVEPTTVESAEITPVIPSTPPLEAQTWQLEVEATTQAANQKIEQAFGKREAALQTQVEQRQTALGELDSASQAQINELQARLLILQGQIDHQAAGLPNLQTQAAALQQTIQDDEATYQREMAKLADTEQQLRQQLETATAQLNTAYDALTRRQTPAVVDSGRSDSSNSSKSRSEKHEDDHHEHEDDHEDDD